MNTIDYYSWVDPFREEWTGGLPGVLFDIDRVRTRWEPGLQRNLTRLRESSPDGHPVRVDLSP